MKPIEKTDFPVLEYFTDVKMLKESRDAKRSKIAHGKIQKFNRWTNQSSNCVFININVFRVQQKTRSSKLNVRKDEKNRTGLQSDYERKMLHFPSDENVYLKLKTIQRIVCIKEPSTIPWKKQKVYQRWGILAAD